MQNRAQSSDQLGYEFNMYAYPKGKNAKTWLKERKLSREMMAHEIAIEASFQRVSRMWDVKTKTWIFPVETLYSQFSNLKSEDKDAWFKQETFNKRQIKYFFIQAVKSGDLDTVKYLVENAYVDPELENNYALCKSAANGDLEIMKYLIQGRYVIPTVRDNCAFRYASELGHLDVVRYLLQTPQVDPTAKNNYAIRKAASNGHLEMVNFLIENTKADVTAKNNYAIRHACANGRLEVVKYLIENTTVDPTAQYNAAICKASANGHIEVVQYLINDARIKLKSSEYVYAIGEAISNRHVNVVLFFASLPEGKHEMKVSPELIVPLSNLLWEYRRTSKNSFVFFQVKPAQAPYGLTEDIINRIASTGFDLAQQEMQDKKRSMGSP